MTKDQLADAWRLRGKFVRFNHEPSTSAGHLVANVTDDGMIELSDFFGLFASHLFVKVDRPHSASEGNC